MCICCMSVTPYHGLSDVILNVNGHISKIAECVEYVTLLEQCIL